VKTHSRLPLSSTNADTNPHNLLVRFSFFVVFVGQYFYRHWAFLVWPLFKRFRVSEQIKSYAGLFLKTGFLIGAVLFMTGGFGYARLRPPIEPLMIIIALATGEYLLKNKNSSTKIFLFLFTILYSIAKIFLEKFLGDDHEKKSYSTQYNFLHNITMRTWPSRRRRKRRSYVVSTNNWRTCFLP
jgi:hypothetical protein